MTKALYPSWLIAVALSLTSATQIRLPGLPIGAGELLICAWLFVLIAAGAKAREFPRNLATGFAGFWMASLLGLAIGCVNSVLQGVDPPAGQRFYDTAAFVFCAAISLALAHDLGKRPSERSAVQLGISIAIPMVGFWLVALTGDSVAFVKLWDDFQYLGWSANHNQTALAMIPVPFLLLHFLERKGSDVSWWAVLALGFLMGATIAAGWATASRAFRLTLALSTPFLLIGLVVLRNLYCRRTMQVLLAAICLAGVVAIGANVFFGPGSRPMHREITQSEGLSQAFEASVLNRGYPGMPTTEVVSVRGPLLLHGLTAIADSWLLGFGPGSFSGIEAAYQGSEVHNSFLDWFVRTGLLGIVALLAFLLQIARRLWRARCYGLLLGLVALLMFGQFHFILRHPLVWAYLAISWTLGEKTRNASAEDERSRDAAAERKSGTLASIGFATEQDRPIA